MVAMTLEATAQEEQLVEFCLADEIYGMDISLISEIIRLREITQIPRTAPDIEGVINLRGKIVPILDLRKRLGLPSVERDGRTRIIVVAVADCTIGMVVDSVTGVLRIAQDKIEPPSELVSDVDSNYILGVGKSEDKLVILLDVPKVLRIQS